MIQNISPFLIGLNHMHNSPYWTDDVKMMSKVQPVVGYWTNCWLRKPGDDVELFRLFEQNGGTVMSLHAHGHLHVLRILLNRPRKKRDSSSLVFRRIWRILQISEGVIHEGWKFPPWSEEFSISYKSRIQ